MGRDRLLRLGGCVRGVCAARSRTPAPICAASELPTTMTGTVDLALEGISSQEAAQRLATDGPNELPSSKKRNLL
ncbi:MAG: cation-transporting P-type ATPase, partial [Acidimicrobiia bacterium]